MNRTRLNATMVIFVAALRWDDLASRKLGFDDIYYLREDQAKPFDPAYPWKEGGVIPQRTLRPPDGSHADIRVHGGPARCAGSCPGSACWARCCCLRPARSGAI